jgi:hypothetical protein
VGFYLPFKISMRGRTPASGVLAMTMRVNSWLDLFISGISSRAASINIFDDFVRGEE